MSRLGLTRIGLRYHSLVMTAGSELETEGQEAPSSNPFGILEALFGLAAGFVIGALAVAAYDSSAHLSAGQTTPAKTVIGVVALWVGFVGAAVIASRLWHSRPGQPSRRSALVQFRDDYGLWIRPWPDIPLGLAVGVGSQYLLVPALELLLEPFVPHLYSKLGRPTHQLLGPSSTGTGWLVVLGLVICVGSPLVEELFFRGLFLRGLLYQTRGLGRRAGPAVALVVTGLFFGLVHFEPLQFIGLAGFGVVLSFLAWRTGRLGPGIVAHLAFNTTTVLVYVFVR